jgi:hypothetical protein
MKKEHASFVIFSFNKPVGEISGSHGSEDYDDLGFDTV